MKDERANAKQDEQEQERRRDDALRRALAMPPQKHNRRDAVQALGDLIEVREGWSRLSAPRPDSSPIGHGDPSDPKHRS